MFDAGMLGSLFGMAGGGNAAGMGIGGGEGGSSLLNKILDNTALGKSGLLKNSALGQMGLLDNLLNPKKKKQEAPTATVNPIAVEPTSQKPNWFNTEVGQTGLNPSDMLGIAGDAYQAAQQSQIPQQPQPYMQPQMPPMRQAQYSPQGNGRRYGSPYAREDIYFNPYFRRG